MSGKTLDENLKYISVRNQWGCQKLPKTVLAAEGKGEERVRCACELVSSPPLICCKIYLHFPACSIYIWSRCDSCFHFLHLSIPVSLCACVCLFTFVCLPQNCFW